MISEQFYDYLGPFTLRDILSIAHIDDINLSEEQKGFTVHRVAKLDDAKKGDIAYVYMPKYLRVLPKTEASFVIVKPEWVNKVPERSIALPTATPHKAMGLLMQAFYTPKYMKMTSGIHPTAVVSSKAILEKGVTVGAYSVIEDNVHIGANTHIENHVNIGFGVSVGESSLIHNFVDLKFCEIGKHALIENFVSVGSRGFGFSIEDDEYTEIPQLGRVLVGDYVELSSGVKIDRGHGLDDTVIGDYVKMDNLTHIGHNTHIDHHTVVSVLVAMSGVRIGHHVLIGAQVGINSNAHVAEKAIIYPKTAVGQSVPAGARVAGFPAEPAETVLPKVAAGANAINKAFRNQS